MKLGGAKLQGATLIEPNNFDDDIEKCRQNNKKTFGFGVVIVFISVVLCYFLANISHIDIHTLNQSILIPTSNILSATKVPIPNKYWLWIFIPVVLLVLYCIIHHHLHKNFFDNLIKLPSVFSGGRKLNDVVRVYGFDSFILKDFPHLEGNYGILEATNTVILILLYWIACPGFLFFFWYIFLPLHDWNITTLHIILFSLMSFLGLYSYYLGRGILRHGIQFKSFSIAIKILFNIGCDRNSKWKVRFIIYHIALLLIILYMILVSLSAISSPFQLPLDFCYSDFRNKEIKGVIFINYNSRYNLRYILGQGCTLIECTIYDADFFGGRLQKSTFSNTTLEKADFTLADLIDSKWHSGDLSGAYFNGAHLDGAKFYKTALQKTKWIKAQLPRAEFHGNKLEGSHFDGAKMQGAKFFVVRDLKRSPEDRPNLNGVSFKDADLRGADLSHLCLDNVDFAGAKLEGTNLRYSDYKKSKNLTPEQLKVAITGGNQRPGKRCN